MSKQGGFASSWRPWPTPRRSLVDWAVENDWWSPLATRASVVGMPLLTMNASPEIDMYDLETCANRLCVGVGARKGLPAPGASMRKPGQLPVRQSKHPPSTRRTGGVPSARPDRSEAP